MNFIETIKAKFNGDEKKLKILMVLNTYIITQSILVYMSKYKLDTRKFLFNGVSHPNSSHNSHVAFGEYFATFLGICLLLYITLKVIQHFMKSLKFQYAVLLISILLFSIVNVIDDQTNIVFAITLSVIVVLIYYYVIIKKNIFDFENFEISDKKSYIIILVAFLCYLLIVGGLTVLRYINYHQDIWDTSIFCQMFHYLATTFEPNTTIERRKLISHFAIHFSPIYYTLLPGFLIFRTPIYLAIMKSILLASAAFPLYKLGKEKGLSNFLCVLISLTYLLSPMLISSNIGDGNGHILNENYFYPAILVWLFYYVEKGNLKAIWIFSILTLFVKEDGAIIVASVALYMLLSRKSKKHGLYLFVISGLYFVICTKYIMPSFGKEVLIASMYSNFVPSNGSEFLSIFYAFVFKPSYVLQQVFTDSKITFLLQLLTPLLFLPLVSLKKFQNLVLIIPIVMTSLLCKNHMYIYSFSSHHNMAPICIVFYLSILTLSTIKSKQLQSFLIISSLCVTCIFCVSYNTKKLSEIKYYEDNKTTINLLDKALDKIPQNASVSSTPSLSTKLTNRDILYPYNNNNTYNCDYIVIDLRCIDEKFGYSIRNLLSGSLFSGYDYNRRTYGVLDYKKNLYLILEKNHSNAKNDLVYSEQFGNQ